MPLTNTGRLTLALTAAALTAPVALAQDAEMDRVAELLSGSWKTTSAVEAMDGEAEQVVLHIAEVELPGFDKAFYGEMTRASEPIDPYRQVIYELYRFGEDRTLRLRTHEIRNAAGLGPSLLGLWAVPSVFPELGREDLQATLDIDLSADGDGFAGSTPYPYPTGWRGAVQMTSSVEIAEGRFVTTDEGIAADGSSAWGGDAYTFEPFESGVEVEDFGDGLYRIQFAAGDGDAAGEGDEVTVHYSGFVQDLESDIAGGSKFDSSYDRPQGPQPFTFPLPGRLIEGWNRATPGVKVDGIYRLIIPGDLAYGPRGRPGIPPNATLFFTLEILDIVTAAERAEAQEAIQEVMPEAPESGDDGG